MKNKRVATEEGYAEWKEAVDREAFIDRAYAEHELEESGKEMELEEVPAILEEEYVEEIV